MEKIIFKKNRLSTIQKVIISILSLCVMCCILFLFTGIQNYIIAFIGKVILRRSISNQDNVHFLLTTASCMAIFLCTFLMVIVIFFKQLLSLLSMVINKQMYGATTKDAIFEQPFLLIFFVFILYLVKNVLFAVAITGYDIYVIMLTILLHIFISFITYRKRNINLTIHFLICYSILVFSLLVNAFIFDYSYDGQSYHQVAAIQINEGWNPFYENLPEEGVFVWNNHYPKFTEVFASVFLSAFDNIELGKSYNIIFLLIVFIYACKYTSKFQKNKLTILALSIIFAANPVVLSQLFTFYVDGILGMLIIILLFSCMDYEQKQDFKDLIIIIAVAIFCINTKFTGFICGFILIGYIMKQFFARRHKQMAVLIVAGFSILLIGIVFTGYNPYITNMKDFGHPFYPLFGSEAVDIISDHQSEKFISMHPIQKFFSLFFLEYNLEVIPFNPLKLLKLVSLGYDLRIGGFGLLFAELSIFLILIIFISIKAKNVTSYKTMLFPMCLLLFISIIMPANWWARYIAFFWYLFGFLLMASDYTKKLSKNMLLVCLVVCCINSGSFLFLNTMKGIIYTASFKNFIVKLNETKNETIHVVLREDYFSYSVAEKLRYYDIKKNIIFIRDDDKLFSNGIQNSYILGWY